MALWKSKKYDRYWFMHPDTLRRRHKDDSKRIRRQAAQDAIEEQLEDMSGTTPETYPFSYEDML